MAKRSPQTFLKRQRQHQKAEKAAQKRARRAEKKDDQPDTVEPIIVHLNDVSGDDAAPDDASD